MQVIWHTLLMKFQIGGVMVTLQGDPSLGKSLVSLKAMIRIVQHEGEALLLEYNHVAAPTSLAHHPIPDSIASLLHQFHALFEQPTGLPPLPHMQPRSHYCSSRRSGSNKCSSVPLLVAAKE
ncbi:hypothetical protein TorRG33x02_129530 [Trema orientale]|uniref:Uncharacterized protein n=1 Tax=Trema orientale TaxID=63057 RepID=A0A2P5F0T5_TREOI|nr:hypothetical protein TorRG33x02_129530 [Trema orientale]